MQRHITAMSQVDVIHLLFMKKKSVLSARDSRPFPKFELMSALLGLQKNVSSKCLVIGVH